MGCTECKRGPGVATYLDAIILVGCLECKKGPSVAGYLDVTSPESCLNGKDPRCRLFKCS